MDTGQKTSQSTATASTECSEEEKKIMVLQCAISESNSAALPGADVLTEILFSPNENVCFFLDVTAAKELEKYTQPLDEAAKKLVEAANSEVFHSEALCEAKHNLLAELHKIGSAKSNNVGKLKPLADGEIPEDFKFKEMLSLSKKQYRLVPKTFLETFESKPKHFFKLPKAVNDAFKESSNVEEFEEKSKKEETFNKKVAKAVMKDIVSYLKDKVSVDWKLEYEKTDTVSSKLVVQGVAPWLATFIADESFEAIDKWVDWVNEEAKWSGNQHKASIEAAITALKKPLFDRNKNVMPTNNKNYAKNFFISQDWDFARRMIMDVWGSDHELFVKWSLEDYETVKSLQYRKAIIEEISKAALPKVQWDGSAGAQLMRYSLGSSLGADFTLWKGGKLAISAETKAEFSLVEAKAEGNFYIPHSDGYSIKPKVLVKKEKLEYKPVGDSESDGTTHFLTDKSSVPFFAVDCCLLPPMGAVALLEVLKHWGPTSEQAHQTKLGGERPCFLQVEGYTSATGSEAHNLALGALRAYTVVDFITQNTASWVGNFKCGRWGREEIDFMAYANIILGQPNKFNVDWSHIGRANKKVSLLQQLLSAYPELKEYRKNISPDFAAHSFVEGDIWEETTSSSLMVKSLFAGETYSSARQQWRVSRIQDLIELYFSRLYTFACKQNKLHPSAYPSYLKTIRLYHQPAVSYGESKLKVEVLSEAYQNRRCEFLAWEVDPTKCTVTEEKMELYLGDIRCKFHGSLQGWAGANVQLGAKLEISCPKGMLNIVGTNEHSEESAANSDSKDERTKNKSTSNKKTMAPEAKAEVTGAAFAGVKGEAGIKAIVDWRKPPKDGFNNFLSKDFLPFGSVGYTVTGMLGVGLGGEFKIGFDSQSGSFVIKVKAEAALGPGAGGELDIAVGTANLWEFAVFVFDEMQRNHFSRIDIFETEQDESGVDVFDVFCSWGWKLFAVSPHVAGVVMVASVYSDDILANATDLLDSWNDREGDIAHLEQTIENINNNPEFLRVLLPETKGRMFFELLYAPYSVDEVVENILSLDLNRKREGAAKNLIMKSIHSQADWMETLEHIGEFNGGEFVPQITPGASQAEKTKRRNLNLQLLRSELLNDTDDWAEIEKHINSLSV